MDEIDTKIRDTLLYIKANPGCNTDPECLDGYLIKYLHNKGLIDGINITTLSPSPAPVPPEYIDLRININGEKRLTSLSTEGIKERPYWQSNPFLLTALTIIAIVIAAGIIYVFGWHK